MYHSGSGAGKTRLMWNDGREIVWNYLVRAVQDDGEKGLKLIIKRRAYKIKSIFKNECKISNPSSQ